ncbi:hypothetical protein [Leucobacter sp.]
MDNMQLLLVIQIAAAILGFLFFWLLLYAVIRTAVLSALRAHSEEQRESGRLH